MCEIDQEEEEYLSLFSVFVCIWCVHCSEFFIIWYVYVILFGVFM